ncbi:MAG: hypothetical protein Q4C47_09105 [Planctomycetia bacterium]|nr:hypothetical protein [Planctomycetia bacterium]
MVPQKPSRFTLIPVTPELAAILRRDPLQLEESLCVAYDGPPIDGELAERLRNPDAPAGITSVTSGLWLVRMNSEDMVIGWIAMDSVDGTGTGDGNRGDRTCVKMELSPAHQNVGYESELAELAMATGTQGK